MHNLVEAINTVKPLAWLMIFLLFVAPKVLRMVKKDDSPLLLTRITDALNNMHSNVIGVLLITMGFLVVLYGKSDPGLVVLGGRLLTLNTGNGNGNGKDVPKT